MPAYKDANGTWYASYFVKDHTGKSIRKKKRGFKTKRDADRFIAEQTLKSENNLEMKFGSFVEQYYIDMENRIKLNTMLTKKAIIELKILPFFNNNLDMIFPLLARFLIKLFAPYNHVRNCTDFLFPPLRMHKNPASFHHTCNPWAFR